MERIYIDTYDSLLGVITLASDGWALTGLWFEGQKYFLGKYKDVEENAACPVFGETKEWLEKYFKGGNPPVTMALKPEGSEFQQRVWRELLKIPYGETVTYGDIAKELGTNGAQAVGELWVEIPYQS